MRGKPGATGLRIRKARASDVAAIASVMRASIRGLARGSYPARTIAAWSSLPSLYHAWAMTAGGEAYLVAEEQGRIAGYAARRGREVTAVFVAPSRARRGLGARLLRRLEGDARRAGVRSLFALAALGAVPFYEVSGYRGGPAVRVPLPGRASLAAVRLGKRLLPGATRRALRPPASPP